MAENEIVVATIVYHGKANVRPVSENCVKIEVIEQSKLPLLAEPRGIF
jgi:hypothetical protein